MEWKKSSYSLLFNKISIIIVVFSISTYLLIHDYFLLCLFLLPLVWIIHHDDKYVQINSQDYVNVIVDIIPKQNEEVASYFTKFLELIWPHMFSQERVQQFKDNLQWVLDNTSVPYISYVVVKDLQLGKTAPQIMRVQIPKSPQAARSSLLIEIQAIYYPSFVLSALVKTSGNLPEISVSFTNLTLTLDILIQFEFKEYPDVPEIPFWTAMVFSLTKPPTITGFDISVFNLQSVFNVDVIKNHMSNSLSTAMWGSCGQPNGFLWDRITGQWKVANVFGNSRLKRCSMKHRDTLRDAILKTKAREYILKYKLAKPLVIVTRSFKDQKNSTHFFTMISNFSDSYSIEALDDLIEELNGWEVSSDELCSIMDLTFEFASDWFNRWSNEIIESMKKNKSRISRGIEERIGKLYTYLNFLKTQKKSNYEIFEQLKIEQRVDKLYNQISTFHKKIFKKNQ